MYKLQRAITLLLAGLLIIFFAFWVQNAHASTYGGDSVAAWKYTYPSDDSAKFAKRLGTINGILLGMNEALGVAGYPPDEAQLACINDNFWPTERGHVGGVIEAAFVFTERMGLDVGSTSFVGAFTALVTVKCLPELAKAASDEHKET